MELFIVICISILLVNLFSRKEKDVDCDDDVAFDVEDCTEEIEKTIRTTENNSHMNIEDVSDGTIVFNLSFPMEPEKLNGLYNSLRKTKQFRAIDAIKTMATAFNNLCLAKECEDADKTIKMIDEAKYYFSQLESIHTDIYEQHKTNYLEQCLTCNLHVFDLYQKKYDNKTSPKEKQNIKQKMENFLYKCLEDSIFGYSNYSQWQDRIKKMP